MARHRTKRSVPAARAKARRRSRRASMGGKRYSGGHRANALWGRGGRGFVAFGLAALTLGAATAAASTSPAALRLAKPLSSHARLSRHHTYVSPALLRLGAKHPNRKVRVIIQSTGGVAGAAGAFTYVDRLDEANDGETLVRRLGLVEGVAVTISADKARVLARMRGLTVTPDAPVKLDAYSTQLWPYANRIAPLWFDGSSWDGSSLLSSQMPAIAVIDSGI